MSDVNLSIGDESGVKMRREPSTEGPRPSAAWRCAGQISNISRRQDCVKIVPEEDLFGVEQGKGF